MKTLSRDKDAISQASSTPVIHSSQEAFEVMRSLFAASASLPLSDLSAAGQL